MYTTSVSLLERLRRPDEPSAWDRFIAIYTPLLYRWATRFNLSPEEAADLVQDVFATLVVKLPALRYDESRSFRGWLMTVNRNKLGERRRIKRVTEVSPEGQIEPGTDDDPGEMLAETEYREMVTQR
jgi:RNA polymerase sigma-70 factor (ECF subfamily)